MLEPIETMPEEMKEAELRFSNMRVEFLGQTVWVVRLIGGPYDKGGKIIMDQPLLGDVIEINGSDYKIGEDGCAHYVDYLRNGFEAA